VTEERAGDPPAAPHAPIEGALAGFGGVAEHGHVPGFRRHGGLVITSVAEPDAARRERARQVLGSEVRLYPSLATLLRAERPRFVDVAAPPQAHTEAVSSAIVSRCHVLVEKPLATSLVDAERLLAGAQRAGVALVTAHNWHFAPAFRAAREAVASGAIGRPRRITFVTERTEPAGGPGSWRLDARVAGGGILVDHGWHQLYLAFALLDAGPPRSVRATTERRRFKDAGVEDTANGTVHFDGGVEASLSLSWAAPARRTSVTVEGDGGSLEIDGARVRVRERGAPERDWPVDPDAPDDSWHAAWFPPLLDLFVGAMADPSCAAPNRLEARACQAVIDAAYRSAARGGEPVAVGT
jgi:predicted dehydrogenase